VQWVKTVRGTVDQGVKTFVEIGPKDTLTNLVKRIASDAERISVGDVASVDAWRRRIAHER
jgi:malonyl CoA-acyl carrier protein transacylase